MRTNNKRIGLEALEDRLALSCTVAMTPNNQLVITGDKANDLVILRDDGAGNVSGWATGFGAFAFSNVHNINVNTGFGADRVYYHLLGDLKVGNTQRLTVNLGSNLDPSADLFVADLHTHDLGICSILDINAFGGGGADRMVVNARGTDLGAIAALRSTLNGGLGDDSLTQVYSGKNDGSLMMKSVGSLGNDLVYQAMWEDPASVGQLTGVVTGDAGNDRLSLFISTPAAVPPVLALLDGGLGVDAAAASAVVTVVNVP